VHQSLADATFRIQCGQSSGSGFTFRSPAVAVTNYHVIAPYLASNMPILAVTENGAQIAMKLLSHSPENQFDFAILEAQQIVPPGRHVLLPSLAPVPRGTEIVFSGFPHGIPDLLTHQAIVSGPATPHGFYIDGSVNGGNSGGPIIEKASGRVIGIVTQRRFLGAIQLGQLRQNVTQLAQHCQTIAGRGSVQIMGVDFGGFAKMMAQGFSVIDQILQANANSGIGIGFRIEYVNQECDRLGLP
jgi:S1-C subfamily serine protease